MNDFLLENDCVILATNQTGLIFDINQAEKMTLPELEKYANFGLDKLDLAAVKRFFTHPSNGYLIKTNQNQTVEQPLNICFNLNQAGFNQYARNLIIVSQNSSLKIKIDCQAEACASQAKHFALTQIIVEPGAKLDLLMEHNWQDTNQVESLMVVGLQDNAGLNYSYRSQHSPAKIVSNPVIVLDGQASSAQLKSAIKSYLKSVNDLGVNIYLNGKQARASYESKIVAFGGKNINNSKIIASEDLAFGHLECDGLVMSQNGDISTSPILQTIDCQAELSHEASISKIKPATLEYLACRGIDEQKAIELIVKGFFDD